MIGTQTSTGIDISTFDNAEGASGKGGVVVGALTGGEGKIKMTPYASGTAEQYVQMTVADGFASMQASDHTKFTAGGAAGE